MVIMDTSCRWWHVLGRFLWRITLFNASFKIESEMRHEMFLKAEALPRQFYHETKVGSVMSWFTNDLETISEYFSWGTIMMQMVDIPQK